MNELKPCPFCGGEAILEGKSDHCLVRCENCFAKGEWVSFSWRPDEDYSEYENKAIEQWNTRDTQQFVERACALTDEKLSELIGAQSDVADIHAILVAGDVIKQALRDEFK